METIIRKIGNSRGIVLPARILKKHNIREESKVILKETKDGVEIILCSSGHKKSIFDELNAMDPDSKIKFSMEEIRNGRKNRRP